MSSSACWIHGGFFLFQVLPEVFDNVGWGASHHFPCPCQCTPGSRESSCYGCQLGPRPWCLFICYIGMYCSRLEQPVNHSFIDGYICVDCRSLTTSDHSQATPFQAGHVRVTPSSSVSLVSGLHCRQSGECDISLDRSWVILSASGE